MISVVIPLYNKEASIERTMESVLSQDYDDFEIIVVDDGSTDSSLAIVNEKYGNNEKVRIIRQANGGPSKARNTGVENAKGEWILFLDADDELLEGALSNCAQLIKEYPQINLFIYKFQVRGTHGIYTLSNAKGKIENPFKLHFYNTLVPHTGSTLISKELCKLYPFNEQLRRYEDFEVWFRMYRTARIFANEFCMFVLNAQYCEASKARNDINEDFVGHLNLNGKSFWEKMCLYRIFIEERTRYQQCKYLFKKLNRRLDLLFLYKIFNWLSHGK